MRKDVRDDAEKINNVKNIHLYTQNHSIEANHRIADLRIACHANYASDRDENENNAMCIVANDADIYILLISIAYYCRSSTKTGITYHSVYVS